MRLLEALIVLFALAVAVYAISEERFTGPWRLVAAPDGRSAWIWKTPTGLSSVCTLRPTGGGVDAYMGAVCVDEDMTEVVN